MVWQRFALFSKTGLEDFGQGFQSIRVGEDAHPDLLADIHKAVIDRICRFIRESLSIKFKRKELRSGSVSFLQRCGSRLNLNLHFHLLVIDGASIWREHKRAFFHKTSDPEDKDIAELMEPIIEAVELCLRKCVRPEGTEKFKKNKVASGSWARLFKRVFAIDVSRCPRRRSDLEIYIADFSLRDSYRSAKMLLLSEQKQCRKMKRIQNRVP